MASFSRGLGPRCLLLLRQQQQQPAQCLCAATRTRMRIQLLVRARFSTSRLLPQKAAPKAAAPKPAAPARPSPGAGSSATAQTARPATYAEQLALRGRTLLYEAPSHFWFRAGCFSSAAFCVSYTVYQYWTVILHPPEGLLWWVPHAFGVILVFMAGMGAYFVMGAGRIVRSIEAVPAAAVAKQIAQIAQKAGAGAGAAAAPSPTPIYIEVTTRRALPFMPPKKTLLRPDEVQLPFRMYTLFATRETAAEAQKPVGLANRVRAERAAREAKVAARKYTMDHLLTTPFRDAAAAFRMAWDGIRRSFSREGFAKIKLGRSQYKLDVTGGWALDDGRAMDRLLPVRPNAFTNR